MALHLVGEHQGPRHALRGELPGEGGDAHAPVDRLSSRHRHGGVVEDLEGDVGAGGDRLADGQRPRMGESAVTDVLEQMRCIAEGRGTHPLHPLAPHLGDVQGASVHHQHHAVTTDPGVAQGALRHHRGAVVGATGAEVAGPRRRGGERRKTCWSGGLEALQTRRQYLGWNPLGQPLGQDPGHQIGVQLEVARNQGSPLVSALAHDPWPVRLMVERVPHEQLEELALLLDDHDFLQPPGEFPQ